MSPEQVAHQAIKYLLSEGQEALSGFAPRDAEPLVKFTLSKLGKPPSLVPEEEIQNLVALVQEEVSSIRKKYKGKDPRKFSSILTEPWYREASSISRTAGGGKISLVTTTEKRTAT